MTDAAAPRFPPRPLRALGGRALETALNRAVALDPDTRASLDALEGKRLHVHLAGPDLTVAIRVAGGKLRVGPADDETPASLRVSASPGSLLGMALRGDRDGVAPGKVEVAGDAELARRLEKLARGYAPDVEAAFAQVFGDVVGVPLARGLRRALSHMRDSAAHAVEDGADWLREEARLGVAPGEMDDFLDEVDAVRERTDRLEARITRFAAARKPDA